MSLWASLGWWVVLLLLVLFYPGSATIWRKLKAYCVSHFRFVNYRAIFLGHAGAALAL